MVSLTPAGDRSDNIWRRESYAELRNWPWYIRFSDLYNLGPQDIQQKLKKKMIAR
jgi:hypothetical protein